MLSNLSKEQEEIIHSSKVKKLNFQFDVDIVNKNLPSSNHTIYPDTSQPGAGKVIQELLRSTNTINTSSTLNKILIPFFVHTSAQLVHKCAASLHKSITNHNKLE
jgi:hypothetical protein